MVLGLDHGRSYRTLAKRREQGENRAVAHMASHLDLEEVEMTPSSARRPISTRRAL